MLWLYNGEGDGVVVAVVLELHGGEVPCQAAKAGQPWCAEEDVDMIADVEVVGINVEDVYVNAEWHAESCCSALDLVATANEDGGVHALLE